MTIALRFHRIVVVRPMKKLRKGISRAANNTQQVRDAGRAWPSGWERSKTPYVVSYKRACLCEVPRQVKFEELDTIWRLSDNSRAIITSL